MNDTTQENRSERPSLDDLIPLSEAAELCGLSHSHLRRLIREGQIGGRKMGRDWFTTLQAVKEYEALERHPGPKPGSTKS